MLETPTLNIIGLITFYIERVPTLTINAGNLYRKVVMFDRRKMKKSLVVFLLFLLIQSYGADKENIPYYEDNSTKTGDVEYLKSRCVLDLKTPDKQKNFPTLVWFHGGGLTGGKKYFPANLSYDRVACATVNYRLSGKNAACPDYIYDAAAAVAWVLKHIQEFGGDPKQVYVAGHSAGGYLATMVALDPQYLNAFGATPQQIAAVFPVSGQMTTHFQILNERRKKDPATPSILLDEYAPISLASKNAPPLILIVGDSDIEWPARVEENQLLEARLRRIMGDKNVRLFSLPTFNHGKVVLPALLIIDSYILN